jgi:hypothetical protein
MVRFSWIMPRARCSKFTEPEISTLNDWIERVRAGDFQAIPTDLDFETSVVLAHQIDGYALTGGVIECGEAARPVIDEIRSTRRSTATALDVWVSLFYAHRAHRHFGYPPSGDELVVMDNLARELRRCLVEADAKERSWLLPLLESGTPYGSSEG